jgi:hypothetical protein
MKLYLAGPMTGYPNKNYPAFHAEAARLRDLGYEVISPAEAAAESVSWLDAMRIDVSLMVANCAAIVTLPGWRSSKGGNIEVGLFNDMGLPVVAAAAVTEYVEDVSGFIQQYRGARQHVWPTLTDAMARAFYNRFTEAHDHRGVFESVLAGYNALVEAADKPPVDGPK